MIANGVSKRAASGSVGISENTLYAWLRKAKDPDEKDPRYAEFLAAVRQAESTSEANDLLIISKAAADGKWQAAAWRLERKYPDRYAAVSRHEIGTPGAFDPEQAAKKAIELQEERLLIEQKKKELSQGDTIDYEA